MLHRVEEGAGEAGLCEGVEGEVGEGEADREGEEGASRLRSVCPAMCDHNHVYNKCPSIRDGGGIKKVETRSSPVMKRSILPFLFLYIPFLPYTRHVNLNVHAQGSGNMAGD